MDRSSKAGPPYRRRGNSGAGALCIAESALREGLIAAYHVHSIGMPLAAFGKRDAVDSKLRRDLRIGYRGDMRCHYDLRMFPERARLRKRLALEDVECRAGEMPAVERRDQI